MLIDAPPTPRLLLFPQVLLVVGLGDTVVPAANSREMAARLPRPWLVLLEGAHGAFLQHLPAFLQVLDAFLTV